MPDKVYVFVDNSNVWIEGKKIAGRSTKPPVRSNYQYRIEYGKLLQHVLDGRELAAVPKLYGSEPPPNDSVWKIIRAKGFDVRVFKRNIFNKEKGVDMRMGLDIGRLVLTEKPPTTIVMVAGDADFVQVAEDAHAASWKIEVWYWSNAASDLKKAVDRFESLNPVLYQVGFDER
ncbi:NYN domain-containing protein [bacterium]|nr:NYN domain-containing protein [bacterium]